MVTLPQLTLYGAYKCHYDFYFLFQIMGRSGFYSCIVLSMYLYYVKNTYTLELMDYFPSHLTYGRI